jgi:hypothetical protein
MPTVPSHATADADRVRSSLWSTGVTDPWIVFLAFPPGSLPGMLYASE